MFDMLDDLETEGELAQADFERGMEDAEDQDGYPDLRGAADMEREAKLDAARVTAHWKTGGTRALRSFDDSPLMGGERQGELFG
jgi:hypothetical protein